MGYFDALNGSAFKDAPDGHKLFFPWGVLGRGYVLPSEDAYKRIASQVRIFTVVALAAIVGAGAVRNFVVMLGAGTVLVAGYALWVKHVARSLPRSNERLSLEESMTSQARLAGGFTLWALALSSIAFVAAGVAILIFDPANWVMGASAIVLFGLCAAAFARMLVLRRSQGV